MGNPIITYNGKTITFDRDVSRIQIDPVRTVLRNVSASGKQEVLNVRSESIVRVSIRGFAIGYYVHEALRRQLEQWWSWAQYGNTWVFARDSAKIFNSTLSAAEAAGQTVLSVASTANLSVNDNVVLRSTTDQELIRVVSIGASTITGETGEGLNFAYANGSRIRHEHYWSGRLINSENPIVKRTHMSWDFELSFAENVDSL